MKKAIAALTVMLLGASSALAVPSLQLGPGSVGDWSYDFGTDTWVTTTNPFSLKAYANAATNQSPWDPAGQTDRYAYLVVSAIPMVNFDGFDVSVVGDGGALTLVDSNFGAPPISDPNSLAPHSIFDTWFEIYEFRFDGTAMTIPDTQPGQTGTTSGYMEELSITINDLTDPVYGVHMDLFTMQGDGTFANNTMVSDFAPFSHDAQNQVPEPGTLVLLGLGLAGAGVAKRRKRA